LVDFLVISGVFLALFILVFLLFLIFRKCRFDTYSLA